MPVLQGALSLVALKKQVAPCCELTVERATWQGMEGSPPVQLRIDSSRKPRPPFWQPEKNWILPMTVWAWKWVHPQLNVRWDLSPDPHLDCSLADGPVKPQAFSNGVARDVPRNQLCIHKCTTQNSRGVSACRATTEQWAMRDMDTGLSPFSFRNAFPKAPKEV